MTEEQPTGLLPGRTAYSWMKFLFVTCAGVAVICGVLALQSFLQAPAFWPQTVGLPLMLCGMFLLIGFASVFAFKRKLELDDGKYTTLNAQYKNVDQKDPYSGVLIRRAEEPFLSPDEFKELVVQSRIVAKRPRKA